MRSAAAESTLSTGDPGPFALAELRPSLDRNPLSRNTLLLAGGWLLLLVAVLPIDAAFVDLVGRLAPEDSVARFVMKWSYRIFFDVPAHILIALVLLANRNWIRRQIGYWLPIGVSAGVLHLIKFVVGRARPELGHGAWYFDPLSAANQFDSFPSGHTLTAVIISALVCTYLPVAGVVFIPAAILAALSRVAQERHYPSDLVAGAGVALLTLHFIRCWLGPAYYQPVSWARWSKDRRPVQ